MLCGADERQWQKQHIDQVVALKDQLHQLFVAAGGLEGCAECDGACCARGQHHMTLVEVLSALLRNRPLPSPDPAVTCPFLTLEGCSLEPGLRPFNCVTFNCEIVEEHLTAEQVARFYALERELRALYEVFEERYAGASLRGLVIRSRRLGGRRLLGPPPAP
ncbi:MAG: hypothetical protein C0624_01130 [Desulfuromonas sp.]|nr:MAG: hypothetical protein C0624_01130 [Desulfuromonas sp.]